MITAFNVGLQTDMREFLNAPNGSSKQSEAVNGRGEADISQSPLGGKTVIISTELLLTLYFISLQYITYLWLNYSGCL